MARVSENSATNAINYSVGKSKSRLEDLQIKGSNLKRIQKPSDDPVGSVELMALKSIDVDNQQYLRNSTYAKMYLEYTEQAISDMTEIISKAKEIAIGQSSDIYNPDVRKAVSKEISQLRKQSIGIANRRVGNRYIFSGFKTLDRPFNPDGKYQGDDGKIKLEIAKNFFVPVNLNGIEVFYDDVSGDSTETGGPLDQTPFQDMKKFHENPDEAPELAKTTTNPLDEIPTIQENENSERSPANNDVKGGLNNKVNTQSQTQNVRPERQSLFDHLETLENALLTNNPDIIQNILERLDDDFNRLVTLRTKIGSFHNSVLSTEDDIGNQKLANEQYKTKIEDADVADLFSNLSKQNNILMATYKASSGMINKTLLDFIR